MYCITKWCKSITDSGRDEYTHRKPLLVERYTMRHGKAPDRLFTFRLLDDDGIIYAYGLDTEDDDFSPLDHYGPAYGCVEIQYKNPDTGEYETL